MERLAERWARLHLAFLPLGALVVTWLLTLLTGAWRWDDRANLDLAGTVAPLGAFAYGALVFVVEWSVRMIFWALAQRKKDREKIREQIRQEVQQEVQAKERERIVHELAERGIEVPPEVLASQHERQQ